MTPLGRVVSLGAYVSDILGRPVIDIPHGNESTLLEETG